MKLKTGDKVVVIAGKDKGKEGKIVAVDKKNNRVMVEGVNMVSKHTKPNAQNQQGGGQPPQGSMGAQPPQGGTVGGWTCSCGTVNQGNFCGNCGSPRPQKDWTCSCGTVNSGNFCSNCGSKRP